MSVCQEAKRIESKIFQSDLDPEKVDVQIISASAKFFRLSLTVKI